MKSGFFIMQLWQTGNIGSHNIKKLDENPQNGYESYDKAKNAMLKLRQENNWELSHSQYIFCIIEIFW
jgi:hypothetical protein